LKMEKYNNQLLWILKMLEKVYKYKKEFLNIFDNVQNRSLYSEFNRNKIIRNIILV